MQSGVEQARVQGSVEPAAYPRRLVGSTGAEHETAPIRDSEKWTCNFHFESKNGHSDSFRPILAKNQSAPAAQASG